MNDDNYQNNNDTPSTDPSVLPSGGSNIGQAATQKVKNAARKGWDSFKEAVGRGIKALWSFLPLHVKIIVIVVILIIIVIIAALEMGMISESTTVASNNVENYVSTSENISNEAKTLYEEKSSLLKVSLTDINEIYNQFVKDGNGGSATQNLMKYEIGERAVYEDQSASRIVDSSEKLPLYKHILLTEKYNFNKINWMKYSHGSSAGKKLTQDGQFIKDKNLGLKYPDTSKSEAGTTGNVTTIKLEKFIDLTLPYLQTWYIPLSISNASIVSGTEKDSSRAPAFAYNVIKEAYHNIVANWYELKKYEEVTSYETYTEQHRYDILSCDVNIYITYEEDKKTHKQVEKSRTYTLGNITKNSTMTNPNKQKQVDTSREPELKSGQKNPLKEKFKYGLTSYSSQVYIKSAETFDSKIINEFNYKVYSDNDVKNRINAHSTSESESNITKESTNKQNMYDKAKSNMQVNNDGTISAGGGTSITNVEKEGNEKQQNFDSSIGKATEYIQTYKVTLGEYVDYEDAKLHTVVRMWKDTLYQRSSETKSYTIDDLISYNQSDDRKVKVSASKLCGSSYSESSSGSAASVVAKEIKLNGKTFPVYNQKSYKVQMNGGETIADSGCGLCSLTTTINAIKGKSYSPITVGNNIGWSKPLGIQSTADVLKNNYGIGVVKCVAYQNGASGNELNNRKNEAKSTLTTELEKGNVAIVQIKGNFPDLGTTQAHYVVLCGIENNKVVIANSADGGVRNDVDMNYLLTAMFDQAESDNGYIVAKSQGTTQTNTSTNTSSSKSVNSQKMQKMVDFACSLLGKLPYGAPPYIPDTEEKLKNISQIDCSGFITALYKIYFKIDISVGGITQLVDTASQVNQTVDGQTYKGVQYMYDSSKGASQLQVGDVIEDHSHNVMFIGDYNGEPSVISQGSDGDPSIYPLSKYEEYFNKIHCFSRYMTDVDIDGYTGSTSSSNSTNICTGTKSGKYYTQLLKTDGLNRIDFMNSNPDIYSRYIRSGGEYLEYVGYSRAKLSLSYWNLKKILTTVYDKNGSLPWAYGTTLGFENIYGTSSSSSKSSSSGMFTWPVPEYVEKGLSKKEQLTATFAGDDSVHNGNHGAIDISHSVNKSAKIVAAAAGKVVGVNTSCTHDYGKEDAKDPGGCGDGFGNYVIIEHSNGYYTLYGHMTKNITVKEGDEVKSGQEIGIMGSTGNSTGNHLHFEVRTGGSTFWNSKKVDPEQFFNDDCSPVGGGAASENLVQFVWTWEGDDEYLKCLGHLTDDGKYYIIYRDPSAKTRAVGHGIDLDAGGFASVFESNGYSTSIGSKVPKEFVDNLSLQELSKRKSEIEERCKDLNLKDYQIDALVSRSYQMGAYGWYDGSLLGGYCLGETFNTAYQKWWDNGQSDRLYDNFMRYTTNGGESGLIKRRESEWKLFKTGVYDASH